MLKTGGRIINIVSGLSERGMINGAAYCTSQGAIVQLTRALAVEWAKANISVNAIGLGWMEDVDNGDTEQYQLSEALCRFVPLKRFGRPEDITTLAVFLASDNASYINGQVFFIDGGVMARP